VKLGTAEEKLRLATQTGVVEYSMLPALRVLLPEYDRRGAIEQRARDNRGGDVTGTAYEQGWRDAVAFVLGEQA